METILIENSNIGFCCEKKYVKKGFFFNFLLKNYKSIINKDFNFKFFKKIKFYNILINKFLKLFYKKFLEKIFIFKNDKNLLKKNILLIFKKFGLNYNNKNFLIKYNFKFKYKLFYIKLINFNKINIFIKLILIK